MSGSLLSNNSLRHACGAKQTSLFFYPARFARILSNFKTHKLLRLSRDLFRAVWNNSTLQPPGTNKPPMHHRAYSNYLDALRKASHRRTTSRKEKAAFIQWLATHPIDKHLSLTMSPTEIESLKAQTRLPRRQASILPYLITPRSSVKKNSNSNHSSLHAGNVG